MHNVVSTAQDCPYLGIQAFHTPLLFQALTHGAHVVEEGVVILCLQEGAGKHHSVEGNIVLGHELVPVHERGRGGGGGEGKELINQGCMTLMCQ